MKLYVFVLLALALSATEGRRHRRRKTVPKPEGRCAPLQPFDNDWVYTYQYVATTENWDAEANTGNIIRINCTATINVPQSCSGNLRVSDCVVEEGVKEGRGNRGIRYHKLPQSESFDRQMGVTEMAFHFNGSEITALFVDKQERTNITNFKRGILSNLVGVSPHAARETEVGVLINITEMNVYGRGQVEHKVMRKSRGLPSMVEVVRDTAKIELPWERKQWNFLRMRNNRANPIVAALKNYVTLKNDEMWAKPRQTCEYQLLRGRQIASAECVEEHPLSLAYPEFMANVFETNPLQTTIRQQITMKEKRQMTSRDRSRWDVSRFDQDTIMFEEEWEETHMIYNQQFDAKAAFMSLLRSKANETTPALISKLTKWMAIADQQQIEAVWATCENNCDKLEKEEGRILYAELLNSCITNDLCQLPYCSTENSTTCEMALETFVRPNADKSQKVRYISLEALTNVFSPSERIVDIALKMCKREDSTTAECVKTIGAVIKNFHETCEEDCMRRKSVESAKSYLEKQLKRNCGPRNEETEEVMIAAADAISKLGKNGTFAFSTVLSCATNLEAPVRVAVRSLIAVGNVTAQNVEPSTTRKLINLFANPNAPLETRVTCFHLMMKKNISESDLSALVETVMRPGENHALVQHCKEDIRAQIMLRGTSFSQFHPEVADKCVKLILSDRLDVGAPKSDVEKKPIEKSYETNQDVYIPVLDIKTNCSFRFEFVYESATSMIPVAAKLTVDTNVEGRKIALVEAAMDIAGLKQIMDRMFGQQMVYSQIISKILNSPVSELGEYSQQYPDLGALSSQGKFSHIMDVFNVRSPFAIRILGYDIGVESLLNMDSVRQITMQNLISIVESLKSGIEQDIFIIGQPFLMQHASPTCIGAPMISTIDFSYAYKNKMNIKADLSKLLLASNERGTFQVSPELHVSGSVSRSVLRQFTENSGTQLKVKFGHDSGISCVFDRTQQGAEFSCTPKAGESKLARVSVKRSLMGKDVAEPLPSLCVSFRLDGIYDARLCHESWTESGFATVISIDHATDVEYRGSIEYGSHAEQQSQANVKAFDIKLTADNRANPKAAVDIWSSNFNWIQERNEVQVDIDCRAFSWKAAARAQMPKVESMHGLEFSFNCSTLKRKELKYFNQLTIKPITGKKYIMEGEFKQRRPDGSHSGAYLTGLYDETKQDVNTTKTLQISVKDMEASSHSSESLVDISFKTKNSSSANLPGYETKFSVKGSILPVYKSYVGEMSTYDNGIKYDKVMRVSAHYRDTAQQPFFFVHHISGIFKSRESQAYRGKVNCISNFFRYEYSAEADNNGDINSTTRLDIAKKPIPFSQIVQESSSEMSIYNVSYVPTQSRSMTAHYFTETPKGGPRQYNLWIAYDLWNPAKNDYEQQQGKFNFTKYPECYYCHALEIQHPLLSVVSISKQGKEYHEEKWVKMTYAVLEYIPSPAFVTHYLLNNLKNDSMQIGYKVRYVSNKTQDLQEMKYAFMNNVIYCNRTVFSGIELDNSTCSLALPIMNARLNVSLELRGEHMKSCWNATYGIQMMQLNSSLYSLSQDDSKLVVRAEYGLKKHYQLRNNATVDLTMHKRGSNYDITGKYNTTSKRTGETKTYPICGSSANVEGVRNYDFKMMCSESSDKQCSRLRINHEDRLVEYKNLVEGESYDYVNVTKSGDRYVLDADLYSISALKLNNFSVALEVGPAYHFEIRSPVLNTSAGYDSQHGLGLNYAVNTPIYSYRFQVNASGERIVYNYTTDSRKLGGARLETYAIVRYSIVQWKKPFFTQLVYGTSPESFGMKVAIPDMEIAYKSTTDLMEPTPYRMYVNVTIKPNNVTVNKMNWELYGRRFEVANTSASVQYQAGYLHSFNVTNVNVTIQPECQDSKPIVIIGNATITKDLIYINISDPHRTVVGNVSLSASNPWNHHIELAWNLMGAKVEFLWDMTKNTGRMATTANCTISTKSWKTNTMTPLIDFFVYNEMLANEPETQNFPTVNMTWKFDHTLPVRFIPSKMLYTFITEHSGEETTMKSVEKYNDYVYGMTIMRMTGCYRRINFMDGFSVCVPNAGHWNITRDIPYLMHYVHIMDVRRAEQGEWTWSNTFNVTSPMLGFTTTTTELAMRVVFGESEVDPKYGISIPSTINLKEIKGTIPAVYDRLLLFWYHSEEYEYDDIVIENSNALIRHELTSELRRITVTSTIHERNSGKDLVFTMTNEFTRYSVLSNTTLQMPEIRMNHFVKASYDPKTWGWTYKHILDLPRMYLGIETEASRPLVIENMNVDINVTYGILREMTMRKTPSGMKLDSEWKLYGQKGVMNFTSQSNAPAAGQTYRTNISFPDFSMAWNASFDGSQMENIYLNMSTSGYLRHVKITSENENFTSYLRIGSLESNITKSGNSINCTLGSHSQPAWNQTLDVTFERQGDEVHYVTNHTNAYYQCITKFAMRGLKARAQLLECKLINSSSELKVEYIKLDDNQRRCDFHIQGDNTHKLSCRSTPMKYQRSDAKLSCDIIQGQRKENLTTLRVTMEDFPFMNENRTIDSILFFSRLADLMVKSSSYSGRKLGAYLQQTFHCERSHMCYDLAYTMKSVEQALVSEVRRLSGPKFLYLTKEGVMEYAIYDALSQLPGSVDILPQREQWMENSITETVKNMIQGNSMKLYQWSYEPFFNGSVVINVVDKQNLQLVGQLESPVMSWLNSNMSVGAGYYDGQPIVKYTGSYFNKTFAAVMGLHKGMIYPIAEQYCTGDCQEGVLWEYDWTVHQGRHNISAVFVRDQHLVMVCDILSNVDNWMNAEISCYERKARQQLIGKLSLPGLSTASVPEHITFDSVLREVLQMKSHQKRSKLANHLNDLKSKLSAKVQEQILISKTTKLAANVVQYVLASGFHEASKYSNVQELLEISKKFCVGLASLDIPTGDLKDDILALWNKTIHGQALSALYNVTVAPIVKTVEDLFEGKISLNFEQKNGSLWLNYVQRSVRYPSLNLKTKIEARRLYNSTLVIKTEITSKLLTVTFESKLNWAKLSVDRIILNVPNMPTEKVEIRFLSNPLTNDRYYVELYFTDMENNNYGCRGPRVPESSVIHMHCFEIEGKDLPPNPPTSKLIAYFDLYIERFSSISMQSLSEVWYSVASVRKSVNTCARDSDSIETSMETMFHVQDPAIRKRLASSFNNICQHLVVRDAEQESIQELLIQQPTEEVSESSAIVLSRQYKSYAYESLQSVLSQALLEPMLHAVKIVDLEFVDNITKSIIAFSAPVVQYGYSIVQYTEPYGYLSIHRCKSCRDERMNNTRIESVFVSPKLTMLDHELKLMVSPNGTMNVNATNKCYWMQYRTDFGYSGLQKPILSFGLTNTSGNGVKIVFNPDVPSAPRPTMSLFFEDRTKWWCCDATIDNMTLMTMSCKPYQNEKRGEVAATCAFTPVKTLKFGLNLAVAAALEKSPRESRVEQAIEQTCQVRNPEFKDSVSKKIGDTIGNMTAYVRLAFKEAAKAVVDMFELSGGSMYKAVIDMFDFWSKMVLPSGQHIELLTNGNFTYNVTDAIFAFVQNVTDSLESGLKILYKSGYAINEFVYQLPTYLQSIGASLAEKSLNKHLDYMQILARNAWRGDNCLFGIVSSPENENLFSLNRHYYRIPRNKMARCPYKLAEDVIGNTFRVMYVREDIEIHLPGMSIAIDPEMKVFTLNEAKAKTEVSLPLFLENVSCVARREQIYCSSPFITVTVRGHNNLRQSVFVRVAEKQCQNTRGMLGIGANSTAVPPMQKPDKSIASTLEEFMDSYSVDKSCHVGTVRVNPESPNKYCKALFNSPRLHKTCSQWKELFNNACKSANPRSAEEACVYGKLLAAQCNSEGSPVKMPKVCELCKGQPSTRANLEKVQITVMMSLNRNGNQQRSLPEILRAAQETAASQPHPYELSFVTYGGEGQRQSPALYLRDGKFSRPATLPWVIPADLEFNGPPTQMEALRNALWFAVMNTNSTASGVGRILLLATPEDLEYSMLSTSTIAKRMKDEGIKTYLLIPEDCSSTGAKARTTVGVRKLFTPDYSADMCRRSAVEVARDLMYPTSISSFNCVCQEDNPFTGETRVTCRP